MSGNSRRVVSICGPAGTGKSQLAKALAERLGPVRCARIPTDYFLLPSNPSSVQPYRWDWELLKRVLAFSDGTSMTTPSFDFERMCRLAETGGRPFTLRSTVLIDAIEPYPRSGLTILITAPEAMRRERIVARDEVWGSRTRDRWERLELTWKRAWASHSAFDLELGRRSHFLPWPLARSAPSGPPARPRMPLRRRTGGVGGRTKYGGAIYRAIVVGSLPSRRLTRLPAAFGPHPLPPLPNSGEGHVSGTAP